MTLALPTPVSPTTTLPELPQQQAPQGLTPPQGQILPSSAGYPAGNAGTTAQAQTANSNAILTVGQAMAQGILPAQVQVVSYTPVGGAAVSFANYLNATLASLVSAGLIPLNALLPQLTFASPNASYGGA